MKSVPLDREMRIIWFIVVAAAVCFVMSIFWPNLLFMSSVVPGQYPIDTPRPTWPVTQSVGLYRPTDSDSFVPFAKDAKFRCGTSKFCSDPSVSLDI